MGGSQSSEAEPLTKKEFDTEMKRTYKTPDTRQKDRFLTSDTSLGGSSTFEMSIDKFDYALVFELTEGHYEKAEHKSILKWKQYREDFLLKCIPDEPKSLKESIVEGIGISIHLFVDLIGFVFSFISFPSCCILFLNNIADIFFSLISFHSCGQTI